MQVDKDSKVIILPRSTSTSSLREYKIVNLPITSASSSAGATKSYLIQDSKIYELNVIKGENSNIKLKSGDAVKSFIFEPVSRETDATDATTESSSDDGNVTNGAVLQSCHTLIASPYNFTYLLIAIFEKHGDKFSRFHTLDDIRDTLSSLESGQDWVYDVPRKVFLKSLANVCKSIIESCGGGGGEEEEDKISEQDSDDRFYKYSSTRSTEWVNSKIVALHQWILHSDGDNRPPTNSLMTKIKKELHDPTVTNDPSANQDQQQQQHELINEMALIYAIDYICDSYIANLKPKIISQYNYNFTKVDGYLTSLKQKQKDLEAIEANMNEVITTTANSNKSASAAKKNGKKKPVKKVAVGKGALDGFFKKA
ncbi:hypothetical protein CANMA_000305 [Candida margitis]|uniref:uncharacterized protein n=1 Tax=Candida margitis TaxID=1775924 RepID=UPI002226A7D0|nr:uncharacterized protein CANMA_000305 [Candida margitis]KAI5970638.1 hypothetical protein CANMA_000305 [Candida margitis]